MSDLRKNYSTDFSDADENGRAVSLADLNYDGHPDILYMNWLGPNRLLLQNNSATLPALNQVFHYAK